MKSFIKYLEEQIEGCELTKAPYRDKIIYQLVLDEYKKQLTLTDVSRDTNLKIMKLSNEEQQEVNYLREFQQGYAPMTPETYSRLTRLSIRCGRRRMRLAWSYRPCYILVRI